MPDLSYYGGIIIYTVIWLVGWRCRLYTMSSWSRDTSLAVFVSGIITNGHNNNWLIILLLILLYSFTPPNLEPQDTTPASCYYALTFLGQSLKAQQCWLRGGEVEEGRKEGRKEGMNVFHDLCTRMFTTHWICYYSSTYILTTFHPSAVIHSPPGDL